MAHARASVALSLLALLTGCSSRSTYPLDEVNVVSLGFHEHDVEVCFTIADDGRTCPGVRVSKTGEGVDLEFVRARPDEKVAVDCVAKKDAKGVLYVFAPYDLNKDGLVSVRSGADVRAIGGASR